VDDETDVATLFRQQLRRETRLLQGGGHPHMRRREFIGVAGGSAAWPFVVRAQQKTMPVIGVLNGGFPEPTASSPLSVAAFLGGLSETGYVEGQNVSIEYRWAGNRYDRMPALAADLVDRKVDVIAALGNAVTLAAKSATATIPIVFAMGTDPVELGLAASLARPGGNLTGISFLVVELTAKRFDLISELVPQAKVIALLMNPENEGTERQTRDTQEAARARSRQLRLLRATSENEIDAAFASLATSPADAILVGADALFVNLREQLVALASRYAVPAIYQWREFVDSGGLISYGPSGSSVARQAGIYVGKILRGAKPADLPVEQPTKFELVLNLKTAKSLGLTVLQALLARADEVIE
jgi:putative ABC transport system substrate-binding protein